MKKRKIWSEQVALAVVELGRPVLAVLAQQHLFGHPVGPAAASSRNLVGPGIAERPCRRPRASRGRGACGRWRSAWSSARLSGYGFCRVKVTQDIVVGKRRDAACSVYPRGCDGRWICLRGSARKKDGHGKHGKHGRRIQPRTHTDAHERGGEKCFASGARLLDLKALPIGRRPFGLSSGRARSCVRLCGSVV